ncbi:MAG: tannase/feruloyl esterase family alpha/beta hydrolase [Desulfatitalea sp.]|nr:tannase/feruloyl esterase family alpha/beta hydrolase [Desulfatitalea sp.]NNK00677.1 tannase/feruloyl esterase family alpha/beta hydrolase [Desulfatitalea sp.]
MRTQWIECISVIGFSAVFLFGVAAAHACRHPQRLSRGLDQADVVYYPVHGDAGGLAHINYWTMDPATLAEREQLKARRIRSNPLHSSLFHPHQVISGYEATGILNVQGRRQWITLKLPDDWNGKLVVCGTPGLGNEYANETILAPWLLASGYAVVSGNKGLESSWVSMLSGTHPTRHWGRMMHDMAKWARYRLTVATYRRVKRIYAAGLSNGGYQVRRALEIDNSLPRWRRVFHGGLDWSGTYFPDARVLDANRDGTVDIKEYHAARTLVGHMDVACRTMKWAYDPETLTTPAQYAETPRYPDAHGPMTAAGFNSASDIFWGYYNTNYDNYKDQGLPQWRGVGYFNLISHVYRAELLGHDLEQSAAYSCFHDPNRPEAPPALYQWLENARYGGWTAESIQWALANANTAEFKAPMITLVGDADGLLAIDAHSLAYRRAVEKYGRKGLHRLYVIENGPHVDAHADGAVDFNFDGVSGNEDADLELTPMQAYAQRAFMYLEQWVENGASPPESKTVANDPSQDMDDPNLLAW